jgi:hypothetical protein
VSSCDFCIQSPPTFSLGFYNQSRSICRFKTNQISREGPNQGIIILGMLLDRNGFQS